MKWPVATIGEVCKVVSGATPKTGKPEFWDGNVPWVTPKDLSKLGQKHLSDTPRHITKAGLKSCSARMLPAQSVLLSSRAPIGLVAINTLPVCTNQGFKSLVPRFDLVSPDFLFWWLKTHGKHIQSKGRGATFKEVSKKIVEDLQIPLPPLDEQKRIAEILDKVDALRAKRRAALAQLDILTQSLFLDMFGDPATNPKGWPVRTIRDLLESASYGTSKKAEATGEFPVLRMNNITRTGEMDFAELKYMDLKEDQRERYLVRTGDVLFNRTNSADLVGKTAIYREANPMAYAGYLIRLRANRKYEPEYLAAFLNTVYSKRVLRSMCRRIIGMTNINATELQALRIPVPPHPVQHEFAGCITAVEKLKATHRISLVEQDDLFTTLQQRAFRGDL